MSLQHEIIHGHPTSRQAPQQLRSATWPLALWLPYEIYRALASAPSQRRAPDRSARRSRELLLDAGAMATNSGRWAAASCARNRRCSAGHDRPGLGDVAFLAELVRSIAFAANPGCLRSLLRHALEVAVVLIWVLGVCRMPFWTYLLVLCLSRHGAGDGALLRRASRGRKRTSGARRSSRDARCSARCSCSTTCTSPITCGRRCRGIGCRSCIASIARR